MNYKNLRLSHNFMELRVVIGLLYVTYGLLKVSIALSILFLPESITAKVPIIRTINRSNDETMAGKVYEYVFLIFGLYTILAGLSFLHILSPFLRRYIEMYRTEYYVVWILGLALIIFYALVLYSDLPIPHRSDKRDNYLVFGIGTGISFICFPMMWEAAKYYYPFYKDLRIEQKSMIAIGLAIVMVGTIDAMYSSLHKKKLDTMIKIDQNNAMMSLPSNFFSSRVSSQMIKTSE
jgi:hypothetical protein